MFKCAKGGVAWMKKKEILKKTKAKPQVKVGKKPSDSEFKPHTPPKQIIEELPKR
jgi:hypothetical protein